MDTSHLMIGDHEVNLQFNAQNIPAVVKDYYYRQSLPSFPDSLVLNRTQEEPPYPRCRSRGITWRRVLSVMNRRDRPDWYRKHNPQHSSYNWESWRLGNLCVQVVSSANFIFNDYAIFPSLDQERKEYARILSTKNLCIMALLLLYIYLEQAWDTTYQDIYVSIDSVAPQDMTRAKSIIVVRTHVLRLLEKLVKAIVGKGKDKVVANELLEQDPIFDSDSLRSYVWDILLEHAENNYRDPTATDPNNPSRPYVLVDEFTNNIPRDLPQAREYYQGLQPLLEAGTGQFAWAGNWNVERWEFIRQSARSHNLFPHYPDLLQVAHREYLNEGRTDVIPWFQEETHMHR